MIDAPVSGDTAAAAAGTLTFMVGGESGHLERARPLLQAMGKNLFHAGASGAGQVAKVCRSATGNISFGLGRPSADCSLLSHTRIWGFVPMNDTRFSRLRVYRARILSSGMS